MEALREYVNVIAAETVGGKFARGVKRARRFVSLEARGAMTVWGIGGMGKTALISRFMLEHARTAASRFPFAYLDFDRATISPRRRAELLAEMCFQTSTQFKRSPGRSTISAPGCPASR